MPSCPVPLQSLENAQPAEGKTPQIELRVRDLSLPPGKNCIFQLRPNGYHSIEADRKLLLLAKRKLQEALALIEEKLNRNP